MSVNLENSSESLRLMGNSTIPLTHSQESLLVASEDLTAPTMIFGEATTPLKTIFQNIRSGEAALRKLNQSDPSFRELPLTKFAKHTSSNQLHSTNSLPVEQLKNRAIPFNPNAFYRLKKENASKTTIGRLEENKTKNRYYDIIPTDSTMVETSKNEYFNGNLVKFLDNNPTAPTYIATQAPIPNTFNDFWDVVFESNTDTIVMLTNFIEQRKKKADPYWPDESQPQKQFSDVTVKFLNLIDNDEYGFTIREFEITKSDKSRIVKHYHFLGWPDNGVAEVRKFNALLSEVESSHNAELLMVVHCSAGIGRAGTFMTTHKARDLINKGETEINIFDMVNNLREERAQSVQTKEQYQLIFDSLTAFLTQN